MYGVKSVSAVALALLAAAGTASAGEAHERVNRHIALSIGAQHLDYKEIDPPGEAEPLSAERGGHPALQVSFGYQGDFVDFDNLYLRLDLSTAQGHTRYQGGLSDGAGNLIPRSDTTNNRFYEASLKLGKSYTYADDPNWQFTPYVKFITRSWVRELAKPYGYRENYKHQAAGAGLLLQWAKGRTAVSLDAGYSKMVDATMDIPAGQLPGISADDLKFSLGKAGIFDASVSLDFAVTKNGYLTASYGFKDFEYGSSGAITAFDDAGQPTTVMVEPDSKSKQQRVFIGYTVHY
jgi:hypothetical protein